MIIAEGGIQLPVFEELAQDHSMQIFPIYSVYRIQARDILLLEPGRSAERHKHVPYSGGPIPLAPRSRLGPRRNPRNACIGPIPSTRRPLLCNAARVPEMVRTGATARLGICGCVGTESELHNGGGCAEGGDARVRPRGFAASGGAVVPQARCDATELHISYD